MRNCLCLLTLSLCGYAAAAELPGQLALQTGDFERARSEVESALLDAESTSLRLMLARISLAENRLDDAQRIVAGVLDTATDDADAHALSGDIHSIRASRAGIFRTGHHAKEALSAYEAALTLDPEHVDALTGIIRFRGSAPKLFGGSFEAALDHAATLSRIDPVLGALEAASIHAARGDDARHREILEELTRTQSDDPRAWLELGFVLQRERAWNEAHHAFDNARSKATGKPIHAKTLQGARYQIGRTAVRAGARAQVGVQALTDYLAGPRFTELPSFEWAHYRRGQLFEQLDDNVSAQNDFVSAARTAERDLKRALRGK